MKNINRRQFIGGASLLAATSTLGVLAGCSPTGSSNTANTKGSTTSAPTSIDKEMSCDIIVVGAGASGLAACVEAGEKGKEVICLESQSVSGGNGVGVEGCFGINSRMQVKEGISVHTGDLIRQELEQGQYRVSSLGYIDLVANSGDNINWLLDHKVQFGKVDADMGVEKVFHRFATGSGAQSYVPQMTQAAEEAGVQFLYTTHADSLIQNNDGSIAGIYATQNNKALKINAKAVIIATGGYMNNKEYMKDLGYTEDNLNYIGMPGHDGVGHSMALACGAQSNRAKSAPQGAFAVEGLPNKFNNGKFTFYIGATAPYAIWVNEDGERFVNEDCPANNFTLMSIPCLANKKTYVIFDAEKMTTYLNSDNAALEQLNEGIKSGIICESDTLDGLATKAGFETSTFARTIARYNESAAQGSDLDFGKKTTYVSAFGSGPYYAVKISLEVLTVTGSLTTNRDFNALDSNGNALQGLYVVGVEGAMLWANVYSINISGSCNANNINSGRMAARHACSLC